jgi:hypothetical protein
MAMGATANTVPSWSQLKRKEKRRHRRYLVSSTTLRASWLSVKGDRKMANAKVLNVSESGMALELPEPPMMNTLVRIQSERYKFVGAGACRHFYRSPNGYVVGIEFTDGLKWFPPEEPFDEPLPLFPPQV